MSKVHIQTDTTAKDRLHIYLCNHPARVRLPYEDDDESLKSIFMFKIVYDKQVPFYALNLPNWVKCLHPSLANVAKDQGPGHIGN